MRGETYSVTSLSVSFKYVHHMTEVCPCSGASAAIAVLAIMETDLLVGEFFFQHSYTASSGYVS